MHFQSRNDIELQSLVISGKVGAIHSPLSSGGKKRLHGNHTDM